MKTLVAFLFALTIAIPVFSQDFSAANADDSMRTFNLRQVEILSKKFNSREERIAFERLKYNTLKVYPYAQMAVEMYEELKSEVSERSKRKEKKSYINDKENELRERFEKEIREMTRTQGSILIKLINRDTGNSCYEIVKEMKGRMTAFFWNMGGRFYGHNLKEEYNREENPDLELILRMIDNGQLPVKVIQ